MKKVTILVLLSLLIAGLFAVQVNSDEARTIASNWMNQISASNSISSIIADNNPAQTNLTDWYIVNFTQGGFILISADDTVLPILGYDRESSFRNADMPDNLVWFMNKTHEQIALIRNMDNSHAHPAWQAVRTGDFSGFMPNRAVAPLLSTTWDQGWPYNSLCPSGAGGPGGHVYAGCGATTMGQIMKFWQYPVQGTGSHTYTHPTYGTLTANFGETTYNFGSMPNSLWYSPNTAISTLLLHCGIAINMDYGVDGSGASVTSIRPALINYFNFEASAQTVYKSSYSATNWDALLRNELDHARPIFYFGTDTDAGGHAFVCDGYQGTSYFHINWGWSGSDNGYFYVSNLNPGGFQFNSQQGAVIGIQPAAAVTAPTNLTAEVDEGNNILLQWISPISRSLTGYTVYRNGELFTTVTGANNTNCYDLSSIPGTYQYYVIANFTQGDSQPSNIAVATIYPAPVINYQENFDIFSDFNTTLTPWFSFDLDQALTEQQSDVDFPNEGTPMSFIVFNPSATVPPLAGLSAFNGQKMLACISSGGTANNDWLVTPKWNTGSVGRLRFWAKSAYPDSGLEVINIGLSTSAPDPATMTIISGGSQISVPGEWTQYNFTFPANLYSNIFVGIQCVTQNGSMLLLDRFQMWSSYVENEDNSASTSPEVNLIAGPNPFHGSTSISWQQKDTAPVSVQIYDIKGRLVKTLLNGKANAGSNNLVWDGMDNSGKQVSAGIYLYSLKDGKGNSTTHKIVRVK